ncbi:hypothetical protein H6775_03785 [Candidatus Nomurabacteria bacterium]|nr:hypothetical protein [Candidatus Nomurabacteria bacterium]
MRIHNYLGHPLMQFLEDTASIVEKVIPNRFPLKEEAVGLLLLLSKKAHNDSLPKDNYYGA